MKTTRPWGIAPTPRQTSTGPSAHVTLPSHIRELVHTLLGNHSPYPRPLAQVSMCVHPSAWAAAVHFQCRECSRQQRTEAEQERLESLVSSTCLALSTQTPHQGQFLIQLEPTRAVHEHTGDALVHSGLMLIALLEFAGTGAGPEATIVLLSPSALV